MQLFHSWRESLQLFFPAPCKLFLLATVNATIYCYKQIFKFWWLLSALVLFKFLCGYFILQNPVSERSFYLLIIVPLFLFLVILLARASIEKKSSSYLASYWLRALLFILIVFSTRLLFNYILSFGLLSWYLPILLVSSSVVVIWPLIIFEALFLVDRKTTVLSAPIAMLRAFKLLVYNYPFVVISYGVACLLYWIINDVILRNGLLFLFWKFQSFFAQHMVVAYLAVFIYEMSVLLLYVPFICYFLNFYIKKIHDNFDLYVSKA